MTTILRPIDQETVLDLTRRVCEELSVAYSANDAHQSLAELGNLSQIEEAQLFHAVGQRVGIRFREVESDFRDMVLAVDELAPLVVTRKDASNPEDSDFFVILSRRGRKFSIYIDGREKTVSRGWLSRHAMRVSDSSCHWYLAQPMYSAGGASAYNYESGTADEPPTPFKRLLGFLKPESRDIRTIVVFSVFVGILSLTTPLAVEALVNTITFGRYLQPLIVLSIIVFVFLAFRAGLGVLMTVVVEIIQRRLFIRVVDDLALRLTRVPITFLKKYHGPELVNRFFDIVTIQKITSKLLLESLMLVLQTFIGLTVLAFYHPFLLGYDVGLIAIMTIVLYFMGRGAVATARQESQLKYETGAWLQEIVRHPTTFKFNGGLGFAINRADELSAKYIQYRRDHFRILIGQVAFSNIMHAVAATVLLGLGGYLVIIQEMTLGQLVAAELIVTVILGSFSKVGKDLESFYDLLAAVDKLGKLFDLPGEPANKLQLAPQHGPAHVELVDLNFLGGNSPGIRAEVTPGSATAIVGPSGSGKTKLIETMAGLHSPANGYVVMNKFRTDLLASESLQTNIGFINDIEIFEGTVDENLRLGRSEIDSDSIQHVVETMGLHGTLSNLSEGIKTPLSVSGFPLSRNQAVGLVLARALIARPSLLVIDSLLDRLADEELQEVLSRLYEFKSDTTIVIATGRNAIAEWADEIIDLGQQDTTDT